MSNDNPVGDFGDADDEEQVGPDDLLAAHPSQLLSASQAADMLCVSEATLWELVKRDRLQCVEFVATGFRRPIRRFRLQDLIQFIEKSVG